MGHFGLDRCGADPPGHFRRPLCVDVGDGDHGPGVGESLGQCGSDVTGALDGDADTGKRARERVTHRGFDGEEHALSRRR